MSDEVRAHWERGLAEHAARRYEAASAAFAACYRLDPRREFLFAWAQAARLSGDCTTAITLYRRYLQVATSAKQADAAQTQLAVCEAVMAARADSASRERSAAAGVRRDATGDGISEPRAASAAAVPAEAAPVRLPPRAEQPRSPWYLDLWGDLLVGTGGAALATGTLLYLSSGRDAASGAPTYDAYADRLAGARRARAVAITALGAGSVLVAAGVLHMVLRDDAPGSPTRIGLGVDGAQLGLHVRSAF